MIELVTIDITWNLLYTEYFLNVQLSVVVLKCFTKSLGLALFVITLQCFVCIFKICRPCAKYAQYFSYQCLHFRKLFVQTLHILAHYTLILFLLILLNTISEQF